LREDDSLFGCGCSFEKGKDTLYSAVFDIGFYKTHRKITKLSSINGSGDFWYGAKSYGNDEVEITFDVDETTEKKVAIHTTEIDGAIIIKANGVTETLKGKVVCGC